jgi:hypothetical protein
MFIRVLQKVRKVKEVAESPGDYIETEDFEVQEGFVNYNLIAAVASDDKGGAYVQMTSGQTLNTVEDPKRIFEKIDYVKQDGLVAAAMD